MSYSKSNNQLQDPETFNVDNILFSDPLTLPIPNSSLTYQQIKVWARNEDGTVGDFILKTEQVFSFGLSETTSLDKGEVNGYSVPLCMWTRDGKTPEEERWTNLYDNIIKKMKKHLVDVRGDIGQFDLDLSDLKRFDPMHWKRDRTGIVAGTGPTLYSKVIVSKKDNQFNILTQFYDDDTGEHINPMDLMGKYCLVQAAIKFESIYIGNRMKPQIKLYEARVKIIDTGMKRLLSVKPSAPIEIESKAVPAVSGSSNPPKFEISDSEDEDTPPRPMLRKR